MSKSTTGPSEPSPSRPATQTVPPVIPEPVPVIPTKEGENGYTRAICKLRNLPAVDAATTLQKLFKAEGASATEPVKDKIVIVPVLPSNCLMISGQPAAVEEVRRLVGEIDRPAAIVRLEVRITEAKSDKTKNAAEAGSPEANTADDDSSKKAAKSEEGELLVQAEVSTVDNQPAHIMAGRQEPQITGTSQSSVGRTNSITWVNVGTMISMTPRVNPDGTVVLQLDVVDSRMGPIDEGVIVATLEKGPQVRQPGIDTLQTQTTLRLQDGQPMVISGTTKYGKTRKIAVTAHLINPGGK